MSNSSFKFNVVGLGNAIVDVIARIDDATLEALEIRRNGMTLIDEPRAEQLTLAATGALETSGGSGANTLAGLASFGGRAAFIGKVANDRLGNVFREQMQASSIPFETAPLIGGPATARSIIFVTPDGARSMNTFLGASTEFGPGDVDPQTVQAGQVLYLEGYLFDRDEARAAFVHAAEIARAAGRKVALTLSDDFCVNRHRAAFRHLVRHHTDLLFANENELLSLYETVDFGAAIAALQADNVLAAVTRSEKGSVVVTQDTAYGVPAEPVAEVIDTTGAGDQYAAGFLFGFTRGLPLPVCARLGHIAAAEVISHVGPRPETSYADLARAAGLSI
jgi:sugar/nucleoside kinase (ribokinase family)